MKTELKAWNRRLDLKESPMAYHAFVHFRDLPTRLRSMDRAFTVCKVGCPRERNRIADVSTVAKAPDVLPTPLFEAYPNWRKWRHAYLWDERAAVFDAYVEEQERLESREAIKAMNKRHGTIAQALLTKAASALMALTPAELRKPSVLVKVLKEATTVERRARGEATDIVKHSGSVASPQDELDLTKLTDEELDLYVKLQAKIRGDADGGA